MSIRAHEPRSSVSDLIPERAAAAAPPSRGRLSWRPLRTDLAAAICVAVLAVCLATDTWPLLAAIALLGVLFCALAPRLRRRFVFRVGANTAELAAEFAENTPTDERWTSQTVGGDAD
jgi:hypothetical protein